jgi:hypothetical protein
MLSCGAADKETEIIFDVVDLSILPSSQSISGQCSEWSAESQVITLLNDPRLPRTYSPKSWKSLPRQNPVSAVKKIDPGEVTVWDAPEVVSHRYDVEEALCRHERGEAGEASLRERLRNCPSLGAGTSCVPFTTTAGARSSEYTLVLRQIPSLHGLPAGW